MAASCQRGDGGVTAGLASILGMENTQSPSGATQDAPANRIVSLLLAERHSLPLSIALHLVPGALIVAVYMLFAEPLVMMLGYPTFLGWAVALTVVLVPLQFGLLWLGRQRTGRYSLRGALHYLDKPVPRGRLIALVAVLIVWFVGFGFLVFPALDAAVYERFFTWVPFEGAGPDATTYLQGYDRTVLVITLAVSLPFTGLLLPLIEKYGIKAKLCHWPVGEESFKLIQEYRARGCDIWLEVSPLHLWFDTSMTDKDPSLWLKIQMNPAIQGLSHRLDLIEGLRTGFIQVLATDHAPHTEEEKYGAFAKFAERFPGKANKQIAELVREEDPRLFEETCVENNVSGAPWLDTYAPVCAWLMHEHGFRPQDIARVAAYNPGLFVDRFLPAQFPGRNFGKGFGDIAEGYMGSLTVLNPNSPIMVTRGDLKTKVGWSPLEGQQLPGSVEAVFISGGRY
jgi:uncharacterized protein